MLSIFMGDRIDTSSKNPNYLQCLMLLMLKKQEIEDQIDYNEKIWGQKTRVLLQVVLFTIV